MLAVIAAITVGVIAIIPSSGSSKDEQSQEKTNIIGETIIEKAVS